jgi:hypothetical protein
VAATLYFPSIDDVGTVEHIPEPEIAGFFQVRAEEDFNRQLSNAMVIRIPWLSDC